MRAIPKGIPSTTNKLNAAAVVMCAFVAMISESDNAFAWGREGHQIVCAIAWDEMRPSTRAKVEQFLDVKGREAFAQTCNFADEYRRQHPETSGWHYVNVPIGTRSVDIKRDCSGPQSCAVARINIEMADLKRHAPENDNALSVKFLMHFIGDIHQPLHITEANGDQGGNDIKGHFMGRALNIHAVWDSWIITNTGLPWQEITQNLEQKITRKQKASWRRGNAVVWANESLALSLDPATKYEGQTNGFELGDDFEKAALPVVNDRLSRAGIRLGHLLNQALK